MMFLLYHHQFIMHQLLRCSDLLAPINLALFQLFRTLSKLTGGVRGLLIPTEIYIKNEQARFSESP